MEAGGPPEVPTIPGDALSYLLGILRCDAMAGADPEKPLADLMDDLHRRSVAILAEEIDHAAEQANKGEFDPERYRWLLRCLRELEKLPLTTPEERQPDGLATLERLAA